MLTPDFQESGLNLPRVIRFESLDCEMAFFWSCMCRCVENMCEKMCVCVRVHVWKTCMYGCACDMYVEGRDVRRCVCEGVCEKMYLASQVLQW